MDLGIGYVRQIPWSRHMTDHSSPSKLTKIQVPSLPPPSPPTGVTVFPDEMSDQAGSVPPISMKEEAAPSPAASSGIPPRRASSRKSTPAMPIPPSYTPTALPTDDQPVAGPSRLSPPMPNVSLSDIQPRSRRVFSPSLPPAVSDWIPIDNYRVAEAASPTTPHILMPLETEYSANLPQVPPIPRRRKRKGSKGEDGPVDLYKLRATYEINPVSASLSTSTKCVTSRDWGVARAELRHIRAMERIEQKMENGRWSLRQPKKLKAPPVRKAHWDYLLEEMVGLRPNRNVQADHR
jgi:chromatin modification-related protein VID21